MRWWVGVLCWIFGVVVGQDLGFSMRLDMDLAHCKLSLDCTLASALDSGYPWTGTQGFGSYGTGGFTG